MDGKGGLNFGNWNFPDHPSSVNSMYKSMPDGRVHSAAFLDGSSSASEHQASYLKMRPFSDGSSMVSEAADYSEWVHQRNFLSAAKTSLNPMQADAVSPKLNDVADMNMVLGTSVATPENGELGTKPSKSKRKHPSEKSSRTSDKAPRPKDSRKKTPSIKKDLSLPTANCEKKEFDIVIDGASVDVSCFPTPVCSCTGIIRQCYRWGCGGWQSSCCTNSISEYPLPMSSSRPGARMAGRKMSSGAYLKLLQRLATEGYDFSYPVDLKSHWARHGTNKFVTIK